MDLVRRVLLGGLLALLASTSSCSSQTGDEPIAPNVPPPAGKGDRIYEIGDPDSPKKAAHKTTVNVSGAVVIAVDTYDETSNGKSVGSIYVADLGSDKPYSGISLYNPSFVPGNLRVAPGDTLDLRGEYQENHDVPLLFAKDAYLVQLAGPIGTFRFDANVPNPVEIDNIDKLSRDYKSGRKWLNMLVRVKNVTVQQTAKLNKGRLSVPIATVENDLTGCEDPFPKAATLVNELMDTSDLEGKLLEKTVIKSLTGVVTFFCNFHIAPRSAADVEL